MTFRVAAKREVDTYFSILWFNHVVLGLKINQARGSPPLSFPLLAAFTRDLIASVGGSTVEVDTKFQESFAGRIGIILHGSSRRDLDAIPPFGWFPWKVVEYYLESEVAVTPECNDTLPRWWKRLYQRDPGGRTRSLLSGRLYQSRAENAPRDPQVLACVEPFTCVASRHGYRYR